METRETSMKSDRGNNVQNTSSLFCEDSDSLPPDLMYCLTTIEEDIEKGVVPLAAKIAVFDLDNLLLTGSVNEALIVHLLNEDQHMPISWSSFKNLSAHNRHNACLELAASMNSLPLRSLVKATHKILSCEDMFLESDGNIIPSPRPHPLMLSFVRQLFKLNYRVYIITSGNEIASRIIASQFFNIPQSNVFGLRHIIEHDILTEDILCPVPIDNGKVETYLRYVGAIPPLITAGNCSSDIPLLRLTDPYGLCLWFGESRTGFDSARGRIGGTQRFRFVPFPSQSQLEQNPVKIG
jgi:phosphoserine phosphatase